MEERCGVCRHWGDPARKYAADSLRECQRILHRDDSPLDAVAVVEDAESYHAELLTLGCFGCVLFEPVETQPKS